MILAITLSLFGKFILKNIVTLLTGFAAVTILFAAIFGLLYLITLAKKITNESLKTILAISVCMILLTISIMLIIKAAEIADQVSWSSFGKMILVIVGVIAICWLVSKFAGAIFIAESVLIALGITVMLLAGALFVMVKALQMIAQIDMESAVENLSLLIGGVCGALGDNFGTLMFLFLLIPGVIAMPIVIGLLLVSALLFDSLLNIVNEYDEETLTSFETSLNRMIKSVATAIPAWATVEFMLALPGITAMLLVIGELIIAVKGVKKLNEELNDPMFTDIKTVTIGKKKISTVGNIWKISPALDSMIEALDSFSLVKSAAAMLKLPGILSLCLSIGSIAKTVQLISSMKVPTGFDKDGNPTGYEQLTDDHFEKVKGNIIKILTTYSTAMISPEMVNFLNTEYKNGEENMKMLGAMGNAVGGMVQGVISLYEGRVAKFSDDGKKIISYTNIGDVLNDPTKQEELKTNLSNLLGIYISAVTDSAVQKAAEGGGWFSKSNIEKAEEVFNSLNTSIVPAVNTIIENVAELNSNEKFNGIKADDIKTKLSTVLSGYVSAIEELDTSKLDDSKINNFERIQKIVGKLHEPIDDKAISAQKQSLDNISKFIDKASSIDTTKIKSTTDMFAQMAKMSESIKGNFDGLAEALNENLLTVLKELKDILEKSSGIIEKSNSGNTKTVHIQQPSVQAQQAPIQVQQAPVSKTTEKPIDLSAITQAITKVESALNSMKSMGIPVYTRGYDYVKTKDSM